MKWMMGLICLLSVSLLSCGVAPPVKDPNPPTIDYGHKRVETVVCGKQSVGENGCVFPQGRVSGVLKVYRIYEGEIQITGQGCGVDRVVRYTQQEGSEWVEFELADLVGNQIENDCTLSIYQFVNFKGAENVDIKVKGMFGTVFLGTCPSGVSCSMTTEQRRAGSALPLWTPNVGRSGTFTVRGCGVTVVPETQYSGGFGIDLKQLWPDGYPTEGKVGCTFILGAKAGDGTKYKVYRRIWFYKKGTILLSAPAINGNEFQADATVSLSIADGKHILKGSGKFKENAAGNILRFYTVQGRSAVVKVKGGKIEWQM